MKYRESQLVAFQRLIPYRPAGPNPPDRAAVMPLATKARDVLVIGSGFRQGAGCWDVIHQDHSLPRIFVKPFSGLDAELAGSDVGLQYVAHFLWQIWIFGRVVVLDVQHDVQADLVHQLEWPG